MKTKRVFQIVDNKCHYRSLIMFKGLPIEYVSKERKDALVYSYDEAKRAANYYQKKQVPIMIESVTLSKGKILEGYDY